jgi:hypothetical protein
MAASIILPAFSALKVALAAFLSERTYFVVKKTLLFSS